MKELILRYHDPIIYLRKPLVKIKLNNKLYKETINDTKRLEEISSNFFGFLQLKKIKTY